MLTKAEIYLNNLKVLENRYPELAERVKHCKVVNYELFQQPGCAPNVRHSIIQEPWYVGVMQEYFDDQWKGFEFENVRLPLFLGFGLGYEAQYFFAKYGAKFNIQSAVIIEKDLELFVLAMNAVDLTPLIGNPNIHFIVGIPIQDLYLHSREFFRNNLKEILFSGALQPVFTMAPFKIGKDYYLTACTKVLEACCDSLHNFGNCPEDSLIGLENMLDNINEIVDNPGINMLYDKFKDKPAVIVATGPSLKKNVHLLKGLEDKALILSVDASFKYLLENDIKPHMVTSLEREHEVQQFFENFEPEAVKDIYMTACPVLFNHVYEAYNGPKIIVYRMFDHFKWLGIDKGMLDIKLSSSNMAFKIADALGCDPIILVGQDLAYGENDETHATPVPFSSEGEGIFNVKGNYVDEIKTNSGWYGFLKAYEVDISQYKGICINCTEGGAYINGTHVETLQNVIDNLLQEPFYPLQIIKDTLKSFDKSKQDIKGLESLIDKTISDIKNIIELCREGAVLPPDSDIAILVEPRNKIMTEYKDTFQLFLMHVLQSIHLALEMQYAMGNNTMNEWYMFIGDISEICLQSLIKAREKLVI